MRRRLRTILFEDHERSLAEAVRKLIVTPAPRSEATSPESSHAHAHRTDHDYPVQGFRDVIADLTTLCRNRICIGQYDTCYDKLTEPTDYHHYIRQLLGVTI
jgi:hypothetical protein